MCGSDKLTRIFPVLLQSSTVQIYSYKSMIVLPIVHWKYKSHFEYNEYQNATYYLNDVSFILRLNYIISNTYYFVLRTLNFNFCFLTICFDFFPFILLVVWCALFDQKKKTRVTNTNIALIKSWTQFSETFSDINSIKKNNINIWTIIF